MDTLIILITFFLFVVALLWLVVWTAPANPAKPAIPTCQHNFAFDKVLHENGAGCIYYHCVKCNELMEHHFSTAPYERAPVKGESHHLFTN